MAELTRAALFDLDRTLLPVSTASLYAKWRLGRGEARRRDVVRTLIWLAQYTLGILDARDIARRAARPLIGKREDRLREVVETFVREDVLHRLSQAARDEIARKRDAGYLCAIVTGGTPYSAEPIGAALGIEHVLSSRLEVRDGVFTGELGWPFCYGQGKVEAAEAWATEHRIDLDNSVFYSDSASDLPLFRRVRDRVVVNPDPRLYVVARLERWPIVSWR